MWLKIASLKEKNWNFTQEKRRNFDLKKLLHLENQRHRHWGLIRQVSRTFWILKFIIKIRDDSHGDGERISQDGGEGEGINFIKWEIKGWFRIGSSKNTFSVFQ